MNVHRNESCSDERCRNALCRLCAERSKNVFATCLLFLVATKIGFSQQPPPLAERIAAINAIYEEQNQSDLRSFPLNATTYGDYRYNDKLTDYSLNGYRQRNEIDKGYLARIEAISTQDFSDSDRLSHDLLAQILRQRIANYNFKEYEIPLNLDISVHLTLATLAQRVPLDSVKHYEEYIARLHQLPIALEQITELLRAGERDKIVPVQFIIEKMANQCDGIVHANPFLLATKSYPTAISLEEQQRLTQQITQAAETEAIPAYKAFAIFLHTEYAPHGRTSLAVTSLPDGQHRYQNEIASMTTTKMTPEEIHQLGLREVARIESEMTVIAKQEGFADLASFQASLKTNPKYIPSSEEQILDNYRRYIAKMKAKLPQLFTLEPKIALTVEALPSFQSTSSTQYAAGSLDGRLPGRVEVNVANLPHRTTVMDEATAYHEGIPGHHLQASVARQITGLPAFRTHNNGSQRTLRAGAFTPSNSAKMSVCTKTPSPTTVASPVSSSGLSASSSILESTPKAGRAIRSSPTSAPQELLRSRLSKARRIATSPTRRRPLPISWASSSSVSCAIARKSSWAQASIYADSMMP